MCFKNNRDLKHSLNNTDFPIKDQGFHSDGARDINWSELAL